MCVNKLWFALISFTFLNTPLALAFPDWIRVHPKDFKIIENPRIETKLILNQIRKAKRTIDVVTYDPRTDKRVGGPFLEALRYVADHKNVRVRFIRGGTLSRLYAQIVTDHRPWDSVARYLTNPPTRTPIQYLFAGGSPMFFRGWSIFAGTHEKLLIIDGEIAFVTGRGHAETYLDWLDTCFAFKGKLVTETQTTYNNLWETVQKETGTKLPPLKDDVRTQDEAGETPNFPNNAPLPLSVEAKKVFKHLKQWATRPAKNPDGLDENSVIQSRVLHTDVLGEMRKHCEGIAWIYNYFECSKKIQDPVVEEMVNLIQSANEIKFHTLAVRLHPKVKEAILARLKEKQTSGGRDFKITVFTNGREAHKVVVPYPMAWYAGLKDLNDLLKEGAKAFEFIKTENNDLVYLHRKIAVATMPDGQIFVIFGSHNFSTASTNINDEVSFEVRNLKVGQRVIEMFDKSIELNGRELLAKEIENQEWWNTLPMWGWDGFRGWSWLLGWAEANI